jgi:type VI secretion system secreted protein VgrG
MSTDASWSHAGVRPEISAPWTSTLFVVNRLTGRERVSGLFSFDVEIEPVDPLTFDPSTINESEVMGREVTIHLRQGGFSGGETLRNWHGLVQQLTIVPVEEARRPHVQRLRVVPWLSLWNLATSCRIFEEISARDIVQRLMVDWRQSHHCEQRFSGGSALRRYCCQFQETDFNFLSRLLEEEGIFYYFEHEASEHRMILADRVTMAGPGQPLVVDLGEDITHWRADFQLHGGSHSVRDYQELTAEVLQAREASLHAAVVSTDWEKQEYPGRVSSHSDAAERARIGMEREEVRRGTYQGVSQEPRLSAGHRISLRARENQTMEGEYFLTDVDHAYDPRFGYRNSLSAIRVTPSATYRPPRSAAKPVIFGPQPAVVSAPPPGTDLAGTVRVRFPWDKSESNSCWVRFAEMQADDGWGTWFPPDEGQEVLVEFLNGDPDRPVVTGRMYNGRHQPAENDVQVTAIRTRQGQELRFDDQPQSEEVVLKGTRSVELIAETGTLLVRDGMGNQIELNPQGGILIRSSAKIQIEAASIEVTAGLVNINSAMVKTSGVVQCGALITNAVISSSYTPGAGNIW